MEVSFLLTESRKRMIDSKLLPIIERLIAMTKDQTDDIQKREFYIGKQLVVRVFFYHITGRFKVTDLEKGTDLSFDYLDLAAIEIYDSLQAHELRSL